MIAFLLYAVTAGIVLAAYEILNMILPQLAAPLLTATHGAEVLLLAALLNFWKRRVGAAVALLGALLMWSLGGALGAYEFLGFYWLPVILLFVLFFVIFLIPTTLYALASATGWDKSMNLPKWLFPDDPGFGRAPTLAPGPAPAPARPRFRPDSVRNAVLLLYAAWGLALARILFQSAWSAFFPFASLWILNFTFLAAALWVMIEVSKGKNWARITLLVLVLLTAWSFLNSIPALSENASQFVFSTVVMTLQAIGVVLLFSKPAAPYFKQN
jgi:hypothetical protein